MKNFKVVVLFILILTTLNSCGTVKEAFSTQKKNSTDEFLVEKKNPLKLPPDFDELPVPKADIEKKVDQDKDIELLIIKDVAKQENTDQINNSDEEFLELILEKIRNN